MKFVIGLIVLLLLLVGGAYGLAKFHLIPVTGVAKSSPIAKKLLAELKLLPPTPKKSAVVANATTATVVDPLAAQKQALANEQAELTAEKQQLDKKMATLESQPPAPAVTQTAPQLVEIYEAMGPDDLATLFAKQPDSTVVSALMAMDTKKAAKALAAMPAERQVKITALMNQAMATASSTVAPTSTP